MYKHREFNHIKNIIHVDTLIGNIVIFDTCTPYGIDFHALCICRGGFYEVHLAGENFKLLELRYSTAQVPPFYAVHL